MRMNILLWTAIVLATSCSTDNGMLKAEEPDIPTTSIPDTSASEDKTTTNSPFTAQTTVGEVINDTAFGDFGRLLFPVDRSVPTTMTLAQVSTSSVYIFYTNIKVEKTVEILNYLRNESLAGRQIFYRFYLGWFCGGTYGCNTWQSQLLVSTDRTHGHSAGSGGHHAIHWL